MTKSMEDLLEELKKDLKVQLKDVSIIVFGSVARDEATQESDLDLCIICAPNAKRAISSRILDLEKKFNIDIQTIFTDETFSGLDHTFIETILREGRVLVGKLPKVTLDELKLEPYRLIRYDIKKLAQSEKMRIRRILYGTKTKKTYHNRIYESKTKGLIEAKKGLRTGIASILVPENDARLVEILLKENGAIVRVINLWLSQV
jgi:predicted nucleotidyltransferase